MSTLRGAATPVAVTALHSSVQRPRRELPLRLIDLDRPCTYKLPEDLGETIVPGRESTISAASITPQRASSVLSSDSSLQLPTSTTPSQTVFAMMVTPPSPRSKQAKGEAEGATAAMGAGTDGRISLPAANVPQVSPDARHTVVKRRHSEEGHSITRGPSSVKVPEVIDLTGLDA